ncbi:hypothetical protein EYC80_007937 [Monilinia laxa]|uniref:Uncharacterized protein n=1 Tax=Monilinia laxa TaxID=61186 RepID=A0A5N6JTQ1_MONLA|nr:hypothetical protein EYC80_007937 [Monilinia laxa]
MDSQRTIEVEDASDSHPSTSSTILSAFTLSTMPPPPTSSAFKPPVPEFWHLHRTIASHAHTRQLPAWRTSDLQDSQGSDISQADPFFYHDDTGESGHAYAIDSDDNRLAEDLDPQRSFLDSVYGKIHRDSTRHAMINYRMRQIRQSYDNGAVYRDAETVKNPAACRQVKRICLSDKQSKLSPPTQFSSSYTQYDENLSPSDGSASDEIGARGYDMRATGRSPTQVQSPLSPFYFPLPPTDANTELGSPMSEHTTYEDLDSYEDDDGLIGYEDSDEDSDEESDKKEYDPGWAAQRIAVAYRVCALGTIWEEEEEE